MVTLKSIDPNSVKDALPTGETNGDEDNHFTAEDKELIDNAGPYYVVGFGSAPYASLACSKCKEMTTHEALKFIVTVNDETNGFVELQDRVYLCSVCSYTTLMRAKRLVTKSETGISADSAP